MALSLSIPFELPRWVITYLTLSRSDLSSSSFTILTEDFLMTVFSEAKLIK